jgi:hypothetical protein
MQLSGTGALADLLCDEIKRKLGIKRVRGDTFGYLQRSFMGCVSDVDQREAREVGEKAVQYAMWGDRTDRWRSSAPASIRSTTSWYLWKAWPGKRGSWKTSSSRQRHRRHRRLPLYLRPLLGSGMPDAYRLRLNKVAKILNPDQVGARRLTGLQVRHSIAEADSDVPPVCKVSLSSGTPFMRPATSSSAT